MARLQRAMHKAKHELASDVCVCRWHIFGALYSRQDEPPKIPGRWPDVPIDSTSRKGLHKNTAGPSRAEHKNHLCVEERRPDRLQGSSPRGTLHTIGGACHGRRQQEL
jgi:hypothetical protein